VQKEKEKEKRVYMHKIFRDVHDSMCLRELWDVSLEMLAVKCGRNVWIKPAWLRGNVDGWRSYLNPCCNKRRHLFREGACDVLGEAWYLRRGSWSHSTTGKNWRLTEI
jgi:hypothetical protein